MRTFHGLSQPVCSNVAMSFQNVYSEIFDQLLREQACDAFLSKYRTDVSQDSLKESSLFNSQFRDRVNKTDYVGTYQFLQVTFIDATLYCDDYDQLTATFVINFHVDQRDAVLFNYVQSDS